MKARPNAATGRIDPSPLPVEGPTLDQYNHDRDRNGLFAEDPREWPDDRREALDLLKVGASYTIGGQEVRYLGTASITGAYGQEDVAIFETGTGSLLASTQGDWNNRTGRWT